MKVRSQKLEVRSQNVHATLWLVLLVALALNSFAQEESPKLQPPWGEIPPTFWEQHGVTAILSAGGVILFVVLGIWFWLRPRPAEVVLPEVEARRALEALSKRPEDGAVLSRISQVLRQYVLVVFELPPGQPTTAEFCQLIVLSDKVGNELSSRLADFLRQCDERKFANSSSNASLHAGARALELVNQGEARRGYLRQSVIEQGTKPVATAA